MSVCVCRPSFSCGHPDETGVLSEEILDSQQTGTPESPNTLHEETEDSKIGVPSIPCL